jgi:hypothetical protein
MPVWGIGQRWRATRARGWWLRSGAARPPRACGFDQGAETPTKTNTDPGPAENSHNDWYDPSGQVNGTLQKCSPANLFRDENLSLGSVDHGKPEHFLVGGLLGKQMV